MQSNLAHPGQAVQLSAGQLWQLFLYMWGANCTLPLAPPQGRSERSISFGKVPVGQSVCSHISLKSIKLILFETASVSHSCGLVIIQTPTPAPLTPHSLHWDLGRGAGSPIYQCFQKPGTSIFACFGLRIVLCCLAKVTMETQT